MSSVDVTVPVEGNPTTASVRSNFSTIKTELEQFEVGSVYDIVINQGIAADGTDVTSAITAAMATGRPIAFKDGTFGIDSDITITDTQVWIGSGLDKTTIVGITGDEKISINGGSLIVVGIKFDNLGQLFRNAGSILELNVKDCWINDVDSVGETTSQTNTAGRVVFARNKVTSCRNGLFLQNNTLTDAFVVDNTFETITGTSVQVAAIRLGSDVYEASAAGQNRQHFIVRGNVIDTVDTSNVTSSARTFGICCFGDYQVITDNIVKTITTSGRGLGAEGIYSKGRNVVINDNVCVDAVESQQGMITIKGTGRGDASSGTQGYNKTCVGNTCLGTSAANGGWGIWVETGETIVAHNVIEGTKTASASGISDAGGIGLSQDDRQNVLVHGNVIRDTTGNYGIYCASNGAGIKIDGNIIDGVTDAEAGSATRGIAVTGQSAAIDGIEVTNNRILIDTTDSTASLVGVYFAQGVANTNILISGNTVKLADATAAEIGIQFAGTAAPADNVTITNNDLSQCGATNSEVISFEATKAPTNIRIAGNKWPVFQTTSATTTNIARINLADESAYAIQATVKGAEATTITDRCMYVNHGLVYRTGAGSAAVQGSVNQVTSIEVTAGMDSTIGVTGQGAIVTVTGAASTTMNWSLDLEVI